MRVDIDGMTVNHQSFHYEQHDDRDVQQVPQVHYELPLGACLHQLSTVHIQLIDKQLNSVILPHLILPYLHAGQPAAG